MTAPQHSPDAFETLQLEVTDGIGTIRLHRPAQRNALSAPLVDELEEVLRAWEDDADVRAILLTGSGEKAFAAGADISELAAWDLRDGLAASLQRLCDRVEDHPLPTLAALNGAALGGGLELAMACDLRLAAEHARMGLPEAGLGVLPGAGGTQRLPRLVGRGRALEMILTGRMLSAEEAERAGLVSAVHASDELLPAARAMLTTVLAKGPLAIRLAKLLVRPGADVDQRTGLLLEQIAQTLLYTTQDKSEGAAAFLEKRPPRFDGR